MKAKTVTYQRLYSLGQFEHEKISIELEIEEGERASDVLNAAKKFCEQNSSSHKNNGVDKNRLQMIVDHPDDYTGKEVKDAQQKLSELVDDLPF